MARKQFVIKVNLEAMRENLGLSEEQLPDDAPDEYLQRLVTVWIYKGERAVRETATQLAKERMSNV